MTTSPSTPGGAPDGNHGTDAAGAGAEREPPAAMPGWVKVSLAVGALLVLVLVAMVLAGHGPGRHLGKDAVDERAPDSLSLDVGTVP